MKIELTVDNTFKILKIFMIWIPISFLVIIIGAISQHWDLFVIGIGIVFCTLIILVIFNRQVQQKAKKEEKQSHEGV